MRYIVIEQKWKERCQHTGKAFENDDIPEGAPRCSCCLLVYFCEYADIRDLPSREIKVAGTNNITGTFHLKANNDFGLEGRKRSGGE